MHGDVVQCMSHHRVTSPITSAFRIGVALRDHRDRSPASNFECQGKFGLASMPPVDGTAITSGQKRSQPRRGSPHRVSAQLVKALHEAWA